MIKPMLATLVNQPFDDKNWIYEIKWDGFRAIAEIRNKHVSLYSRNQLSFNEKFPAVIKALEKISKNMVLDGEIVVLDQKGKSHFQLIQNFQETGEGILAYYVFDILSLGSKDLRKLPLIERKKILKLVLPKSKIIKYSDHIVKHGKGFYKVALQKDLEGIMAKNSQSLYYSGRRTKEWLKIKIHKQQEAVIGGFTAPRGGRKKFGALVLGVYEHGKLVYIGHTGGGFNEQSLGSVYSKLKPLATTKSPFAISPKTNAPVTWVKPKLVCEVVFGEWTADGHMRQPIFLGLRPDKKPQEVIRELPYEKRA